MKLLNLKFLCMFMCLFSCIKAFSYALIDGIYYNFNGDEAEVTYKNTSYNSYTGDIAIPESVVYNEKTYSVTSIGSSAFSRCTGLTSVTIPKSVTSIGSSAFSGCTGLPSVIIPNSVTSIGSRAFDNCTGLTAVTIPNSVTSIGSDAFYGCHFVKESFINNSTLTSNTYWGATIHDIETTDGLLITDNVVRYCRRWATSITIPNSVTSIGERAFSNCSGLTSVAIPNSVTSIGEYAFYDCSGLKKVIVPDIAAWCGIAFEGLYSYSNPLYYAGHLYSDETTEITNLIIPNSVTSIEDRAFVGCSGLTSVTIPNSVTSIGKYAFDGCHFVKESFINNSTLTSNTYWGATIHDIETTDGLLITDNVVRYCRRWATSITIPNSVTSIGERAFSNCSGLTSVAIPNSVTSIGEYAFYDCSGLKKVIVPDIAAWCGIAFEGLYPYSNPLYYAGHLYNDETTEITNLIIPNYVTNIGGYAFVNCSSLTSVTIPNSVTSIGSSAFSGCMLENILLKSNIPPTLIKDGFTNQTYYHGMLYVPTDCWKTYAYDGSWYQFINIRETATEEEQVAMQQAYTLMDAETFTYSVYDPVNNCIGTIKSVSAIDENNPNHSWQVITDGNKQYLYNLGAKKFATNGADGRLVLTAEPTPIDMKNGDNGIVLGSQAARQWALVGNDRLSVEQDIITGIDEIADTQQGESISYDLQGRRIGKPQQGVNIIRNANGTTKKVLIKH